MPAMFASIPLGLTPVDTLENAHLRNSSASASTTMNDCDSHSPITTYSRASANTIARTPYVRHLRLHQCTGKRRTHP